MADTDPFYPNENFLLARFVEVKRAVKAGDVIWTPPGVRHWHGATSEKAMSHIAVTGVRDGSAVTWMKQVTGELYLD